MSWIKKLLQFLHTEEPSATRPYETETNKPRQYSKHMETKVTYEYPKGKFRFPVIPDIEAGQSQQAKPQNRVNRNTNQEPIKKADTIHKVKPIDKAQSISKWQSINNEQAIKKVERTRHIEKNTQKSKPKENDRKGPFRPTEIPSPVYGFTRPKIDSEEVIEFELTSVDREGQNSVEAPIFEEVIEEIAATTTPTESEEKSDEVLDITDILKELKEEKQLETVEEMNVVVEEEQKIEVEEQKIAAEEEQKIETEEEQKVEVKEEQNTEVEEEKIPDKKQSPRRSHIPFNVLMFKKDKENIKKADTLKPQPKEKVIDKNLEKQSIEETTIESGYHFPELQILNSPQNNKQEDTDWLEQQKLLLDQTLRNFKVRAKVVNVTQGPAVTRFEVHPEPGVKVNKITNLSDDIKLSLSAKDIRIEAPIPGKNTIGIEVPNLKSKPVLLKEIIRSPEFLDNPSPLTVALGLDISGKPIVTDLKKMPHGLIAGATGSGKSVCINAMLVSLLYKAAPHQVKLLLIDPKMVELAPYNHIPHLVSPVITDVKAATAALKWAVEEMERRYELFAHSGVRDIGKYNELVKKHNEKSGELPYLVIIIDELADLMMVAPGDVEEAICRIAQKARACGIHLILATQRPSVDVITGLIKANIPTRIAFSVSSQVDSRTIIDSNGADKLLGKGDMLFLENGSSKPIRVQGNFVSDEEIEQVVESVKEQMKPIYMFEQEELIKRSSISADEDELFIEACEFVLENGGASTSSLQRHFRIGYNRAARLIDMMEEQGLISESRGSKPREVLVTEEEFANMQEN